MRRAVFMFVFLLLAGAGLAWAIFGRAPKPLAMSEPLRIHQGVIIGGIDADNPAIVQFNGIPYARAARWSPPEAPPQWGAVARDVREFGPECPQSRRRYRAFVATISRGLGLSWWERGAAGAFARFQQPPPESEDCLVLNVRTANPGGKTLQPVMVWLHGGAHQYGSGSQSLYQTNGLVERGVVLVTINYRLGALGYLAHPALSEEAGTSGNYGLMDQAAALAWVRDNIAAFGGDPANVTVFGESAGAQSITELMAMPAARGLFHKVILQSGASTYNALHLKRVPLPSLMSAEEAGQAFLETLAPPDARARDLRQIPLEAIIAQSEGRPDLAGYFLPVVDGKVLPRMIGAAFRDGDVPVLPMIAGYNADEGTLFFDAIQSPTILRPRMSGDLEARRVALAEVFGATSARALEALYGMDKADTWVKGATDMLGDDLFGVHIRYVGRKNAAAGGPTYLYHFTRVPPSRHQTIGAFHAAELSFVFGADIPLFRKTKADQALSAQMMDYWTNFAKTGNPNGGGQPEWPELGPGEDLWLELGPEIRPIRALRSQKLDILERSMLLRIAKVAGPPAAPPPPPRPQMSEALANVSGDVSGDQ